MNAPDGASPVVVGTIAFGMGLDKKNVRHVYHFNLPRSPEDLAQQARRVFGGIAVGTKPLFFFRDIDYIP